MGIRNKGIIKKCSEVTRLKLPQVLCNYGNQALTKKEEDWVHGLESLVTKITKEKTASEQRFFLVCCLKQGLTTYLWVALNSICRPGWQQLPLLSLLGLKACVALRQAVLSEFLKIMRVFLILQGLYPKTKIKSPFGSKSRTNSGSWVQSFLKPEPKTVNTPPLRWPTAILSCQETKQPRKSSNVQLLQDSGI